MLITSSFYIVQFSRFALPTAFAARFEDLSLCQVFKSNNKSVVSVSRPPDEIRLYLALHARCNLLVGPSGLEPPTLRLSVVRSSQLSYGPVRRHKLHITRRTASSTSRSFRCVSSSSQTRFAGLCSDFGRFGYYSNGGDSRDRTGDLLLARQALSQLSYIPRLSSSRKLHRLRLLN